MNYFLTTLLSNIGIDLNHLTNEYLSPDELTYLDRVLASKKDFEGFFYTGDHGDQLEVLLKFLDAHKESITDLMEGNSKIKIQKELYTSMLISGDYDCFRFDLSKFTKSYISKNELLTLYRIGRDGESKGSLGCSWAKGLEGLKAYYYSSGMSESTLESRPIFKVEIYDSQVLFEGDEQEQELVLKPNFTPYKLEKFDKKRFIAYLCG